MENILMVLSRSNFLSLMTYSGNVAFQKACLEVLFKDHMKKHNQFGYWSILQDIGK